MEPLNCSILFSSSFFQISTYLSIPDSSPSSYETGYVPRPPETPKSTRVLNLCILFFSKTKPASIPSFFYSFIDRKFIFTMDISNLSKHDFLSLMRTSSFSLKRILSLAYLNTTTLALRDLPWDHY